MSATVRLALYVSLSSSNGQAGYDAAERIAWSSALANAQALITGAMLYTGMYFAQAIEGDPSAVEALLAKLRVDARHGQMKMLRDAAVGFRRFDGWSMAYPGATDYLSSFIARLHAYPVRDTDADRLLSIMDLIVADGATGSTRALGDHRS